MDENGKQGAGKARTLVVAQKNPLEMGFIQAFLTQLGEFRVVNALTAGDVIQGLRFNPDVIMVDMPLQGDFLRAVELMRRMPKMNHVGIVALSPDLQYLQRCKSKGFNGFVMKPFTPQGLLAKIWKVLEEAPPLPGDGSPAELKVEVDKIEGLPTLPTVYAQVEQLCQKPDTGADDLAKVIETDPSITLKLLKLANSAFFGFNRQIKSVRDAVSLLGNETVKNAVLSISVFEATKDQAESAGLNRKEFWQHSAACGSIVRFVAKKLKLKREDNFSSGILHDIGKVILDGLYASFYQTVLKRVNERKISILEAEETALGLTHVGVGRELAESWGIPSSLVEAIYYHHMPGKAEKDPEMACLVHIADTMSRNLGYGSGGDPLVPAIHPFAFRQLAVNGEDLMKWEEEMVRDVEKDMAFLSAIA